MRKAFEKCTALTVLLALLLWLIPTATADYSTYSETMAGDGVGILAHGIDLSSWQGDSVDFERIREQGIDFVILRAGFSDKQDAVFERNYAAAKAAGLHVGAYVYSYATSVEEVRREAESCKTWLAGKQFEYPIYFDLEDPAAHGSLSAETLTELALTFLDTLAADGWLVGLYSCRSWLEEKIDTERIGQTYECWMAQYPADGSCNGYEKYHATYGVWQYSASGAVDGVPDKTDMDVAFKDYPSICREYGFNGYSAAGETLTLRNASVPEVVLRGEPFDVTGRVQSSDGALLRVTLGIYDAEGTMVSGATAEPNADSFDLALIRQSVDMTKLPTGEYFYRISAATEHTERSLHASRFAVSAEGLWLRDAELPLDLKEGSEFCVSGAVLCADVMERLRVEVVDETGAVRLSAESEPNGTQFDLSELRLNPTTAGKGEYRLRLEAETAGGIRRTESNAFHIWVKNDPITLKGFRLNKTYAPAALTGLSGVATSQNSEMLLTVALLDADGTEVCTVSTNRPARTVELSQLDAALRLTELPLGYYVCRITATNDAGPTILYRDEFSVVRDEISLCSAKLPTTLGRGDSFLLTGAVASDRSPLRHISAVLTDRNGVPVCDCAFQPNRTVFPLESLNSEIRFSDLAEGSYRLRITAENDELRKTLLDETVLVTAHPTQIRWDDAPASLLGRSFSEGTVPGCTGTLTATKPITALRATVTDADGTERSSAAVETDAEVLTVGLLNEQLRLTALSAGEYRLRIYATCDGAEELVLSESFCVTDCRHAYVRSGTVYAADCQAVGAVCPTRCMSCGGVVQDGKMTEKKAHKLQNGVCSVCGATEPKRFSVTQSFAPFTSDGRYVLAIQTEQGWYALDHSAEAVRLDTTPTEVSAELLWRAEPQRDGSVVFCNNQNAVLHVDASGLCAAYGRGHTALQYDAARDGTAFSCDGRCIGFSDGRFVVGEEAARFTVLSLHWE